MAALAVILQDGKHVLVEGRRGGRCWFLKSDVEKTEGQPEQTGDAGSPREHVVILDADEVSGPKGRFPKGQSGR